MLIPPQRLRERPWLLASVAGALVLLLAAGLLVAYARGGGPVPKWFPVRPVEADPLADSTPAEVALRAMRLAGFDRAVAGDSGGTAVLRIAIPDVASAAELEIAWQAAVGALFAAYPDNDRYVVQLFGPIAMPLLELRFEDARAVRAAVEADDPGALRAAAGFTYLGPGEQPSGPRVVGKPGVLDYILTGLSGTSLPETLLLPSELADSAGALVQSAPVGAMTLPRNAEAVDIHVSGAQLDAENRAAGLLSEDGPTAQGSDVAGPAAARMRRAVPGLPAVAPDASAADAWRDRAVSALERTPDIAGAGSLRERIGGVTDDGRGLTTVEMRTWYHVATAVGSAAYGSVLVGAAGVATVVATSRLEGDAARDAVLAAAGSDAAPDGAKVVHEFTRDASLDASASPDGDTVVAATLATSGDERGGVPGLRYETSEGGFAIEAPATWLAYRRPDGRIFWLAGEAGERALTDSSLIGWAHTARRSSLVNANDCGRVLAVYPTE